MNGVTYMAGITYKCPSCGGYLTFDPEAQLWKCPFCDSEFEESGLTEKDEASAQKAAQPAADDGHSQLVYHCPSCGSEIMTDETTVATQCYYCHSPVVLQGKLTDEWLPDSVIPFTISKEQAVETFMNWVKSKKYVPKAFFNQAQIESMQGVYYPHFVTECEVEGQLSGEGRTVGVTETTREIITTTNHYHVVRGGRLRFKNIMRPALTKANRKLSDGIHPFPLNQAKPFANAYLSGFLAERRDIDESAIRPEIEQEVGQYVRPLLETDMPYQSTSLQTSASLKGMKSQYVLLPTWVLTYPNKKDPQDPYYYAMNGCTGEICGKLPIDISRLRRTSLIIFAAVFAIGCILSYFMF